MRGDEEGEWMKWLTNANGGEADRGERKRGQMVSEGSRGGRMDEEAKKCKWG